jgi:hypothetical protein
VLAAEVAEVAAEVALFAAAVAELAADVADVAAEVADRAADVADVAAEAVDPNRVSVYDLLTASPLEVGVPRFVILNPPALIAASSVEVFSHRLVDAL